MTSPVGVHTLVFDVFGTVMNLGGSHSPRLAEFLKSKNLAMPAEELWERWRNRQRLQQYENNLFQAGHLGYLDSSRRALIYSLRAAKLPFDESDVRHIMQGWRTLEPFPDALRGLGRLGSKFKLVVLSNGDRDYLNHVVSNCLQVDFDAVISAEEVGVFKPSPDVYRYAARMLKAEPSELMMVSAHSFDAIGARISGFHAGYVNRYDLPYDETPYQPDVVAQDFPHLADQLGCR